MTVKRSFPVFLSTILTRAIYNVTYVSVIWKLCFDKNVKVTLQRHISTHKQFKVRRVSRRLTSIHTSRCHKHLPSLALKFRVVIKSGALYPAPLCKDISGCRYSLVRGLVWLPNLVAIDVYSNGASVEGTCCRTLGDGIWFTEVFSGFAVVFIYEYIKKFSLWYSNII